MSTHKAIFISHAWGGISDEILAELTKTLEHENISFILDKRDLGYRQSINEFMVELGKADVVIIILSNKYLKSEYCMFELIQIYRNQNLRDRIFPIVLDEVKISSSADRLEFVKFWEDQLNNLQKKVKELDSLSYIEGITDDLNLYAEIRNNIARLTGILRDINTLNVTIHVESDYRDLIQSIKKKISGEKEENKIYISSAKQPSPIFNAFNYKLAGISLLVLFAIFVTWKILSKPKNIDLDDLSSDSGIYYIPDTAGIVTTYPDNDTAYEDHTSSGVVEKHVTQNTYSSTGKKQSTYEKGIVTRDNSGLEKVPFIIIKDESKDPEPDESTPVFTAHTPTDVSKADESPQSFTLQKGTPLRARCAMRFSTEDDIKAPRTIMFALDGDIKDGRNVVVPSGSAIYATITFVRKSDYRHAGVIDLVFEYLETPEGQQIHLQNYENHLISPDQTPYEVPMNKIFSIKTASSVEIKY